MTAKTFATLAIMGLAASTSTAALAQSRTAVDAVAAEHAMGAPFLSNTAQAVAPAIANTATRAIRTTAAPAITQIATQATMHTAVQAAPPVVAAAAPVATAHAAGSYGYPAQQPQYQQQHQQPQYHQQPVYAQPQSYPVQYTREQWLEECYARTGGSRRGERGQGLGGLLGAITGGLIGNRVAGRGDRLAGSLIGAGVGGLAGAVAGGALERRSNKRGGYCDQILDNHLAAYQQGAVGPAYNTASRTIPAQSYYQPQYVQMAPVAYAQPMMYVEQQVAVPQRAVVREYVTEEWVEETEYVREREIAPRRVKRVPIKYIKGN